MRILVIDDDGPNRETLANVLTNLGHTVDTAINGIQALEKVVRHRPDLMVVDMSMPLMDGREFLSRLTLPAIVWSGAIHGDEAGIPGVLAVVLKPNVDELLAEIARVEEGKVTT